jgi:hypothetical protein
VNNYRAWFHGCVPGRLAGKTILLGNQGQARLAIIPPSGDAITAKRLANKGLSAYIREKKLDANRYPCFAYRKRAASDCLVWVLVPLAPGGPLPKVKKLPVLVNGIAEDAHGATAIEVAFPSHTDSLCVSHKDFDGDLAFGAHRGWGHLAFRRQSRAGKIRLSIEHTMADGICGR